jgi:hypothetical protein
MADHTKVQIVQRNLHPHTNTVQALTITVGYGDGVEVEAMILLKPGALPNDEKTFEKRSSGWAEPWCSPRTHPLELSASDAATGSVSRFCLQQTTGCAWT